MGKTTFGQLESGSWFERDGELFIKDDLGSVVRFNDGSCDIWLNDGAIVTFVKSVEVIYEV